jgi:hypothetical protein
LYDVVVDGCEEKKRRARGETNGRGNGIREILFGVVVDYWQRGERAVTVARAWWYRLERNRSCHPCYDR